MDDYEPTRGAYDFAWLHQFAALAAARGITLRPYIGYTPAWAASGGTDGDVWNDPPKDLEAWYRFVRTLAAEMRQHKNVVSYEIYNEENVRQWGDGTAAQYRDVLRRAADGVEAGNPDAQLLIGGLVFPDLDWLENVSMDVGSCSCGRGRVRPSSMSTSEEPRRRRSTRSTGKPQAECP
jgi:hypothetical protein